MNVLVTGGCGFIGSAMVRNWWSFHWEDIDDPDPQVQQSVGRMGWADLLMSFPYEMVLPRPDDSFIGGPGYSGKPTGPIDAIEAIPWDRNLRILEWVLNALFWSTLAAMFLNGISWAKNALRRRRKARRGFEVLPVEGGD